MSGRLHRYAVRDGDTVRGIGEVRARPGKPVRFCGPGAVATSSLPVPCSGIVVTGVDLDRLADRHRDAHGTITGRADLTGVYRAGRLGVTVQRRPAPERYPIRRDWVPCATPAGGWPHGQPSLGPVFRYKKAHPGSVVMPAYLNPTRHRSLVYVLSSGDPAPMSAALHKAYGRGVCVQRSTYSHEQIMAAHRATIALMDSTRRPTSPWEGGGIGLSVDAQPDVTSSVWVISPHLAAVLDRQPRGLVVVDTWLRKVPATK